MKPTKKPKQKPALATAVVFQGPSNVEVVRRLTAAGVDTARMEISIDGAVIPQNAKAFITIIPDGVAGAVTMFDELEPINDSHTKPPF